MVAEETARLDSMSSLLHPGDILFDIGAEKGDQSVLYAGMVGSGSMCLFEPEPTVWPNIRANFEIAELSPPMRCYVGLVGGNTTFPETDYDDTLDEDGWPACSHAPPTTNRTFRYIHDHSANTKQTRLDDWVLEHDIIPTAITMDIEGAEFIALAGAFPTLAAHRPIVWVSVHPDLMERDYDSTPEELIAMMENLGYKYEWLGRDHEDHFLLTP